MATKCVVCGWTINEGIRVETVNGEHRGVVCRPDRWFDDRVGETFYAPGDWRRIKGEPCFRRAVMGAETHRIAPWP